MSIGSESSDGSDIFWPGFVDAMANLILNLLFLLTILIIAVFMFALELGRVAGPTDANADAAAVVETVSDENGLVSEIVALKSEVQRLKQLLSGQGAQNLQAGGQIQTVEGTASALHSQTGIEQTLASDFDVMVRFKDEAVSFTVVESARLLEKLKPVAANGSMIVYVEVPAGFSEAKRMGFYRALAVRNLLIQLNVPTGSIDVSVVEGTMDANASVVMVRSR
jgi:hypothetical protein